MDTIDYHLAEYRVDWIDITGLSHEELFSPGQYEPRYAVLKRACRFANELRPHQRGSVRVFDLSFDPYDKRSIV